MLLWLLVLLCTSSVAGQSCPYPLPNVDNASCIAVSSWEDFSEAIHMNQDSRELVFCPFSVIKESVEPIRIKSSVSLLCQAAGQCVMSKSSASDRGGRFIKIKGSQAQVSVFGFVFMNGGDHYGDSLYSAILITYQAGAGRRQIFCNCNFVGNGGSIRGVAIRAEPKTHVSLFGCTFEENSASSIGTIFNRGSMLVEKCMFLNNSGTGGAIGSSRLSTTILKHNSFSNNIEGSPIFFHDFTDYIDGGGNVAKGNDCNGIFILFGQKCVSFNETLVGTDEPTPLPSPSPSTHLESEYPSVSPSFSSIDGLSCDRLPKDGESCIDISSFEELIQLVRDAIGIIVFCPFIVTKNERDLIYVTTNVELICGVPRKCKITGPGRHIVVDGSSSKLFVQGIVFEGATIGAIHIKSRSSHVQSFCDVVFSENSGASRGLGILTERNTYTEISHCSFLENESSDMGGAIFNRGAMLIENAAFDGNVGRGGSIASAPTAIVRLKNNVFINNRGGEPIFFHENDIVDLGNNVMRDNTDCSCCNGAFLQREGRSCLFMNTYTGSVGTQPPTYSPVALPSLNTELKAPRGTTGYFNYNLADSQYGPENWGDVRDNAEHLRYKEMQETLDRSLENKCDRDSNQSPIDLCDHKINSECHGHHQTRTRSGDIGLGMGEITAQILPSKLRLKYYPDRPAEGGPQPPLADFAHYWNGYIEVNHVDLKIPSEHTVCGKQFPAELSIFLLHPLRRQSIVMSILIDFDPTGADNNHLQKAIDQWQAVFDSHNSKCTAPPIQKRKFFNSVDVIGELPWSTTNELAFNTSVDPTNKKYNASNGTHRILDGVLYGKGGWDPFHPSLERSLYHWGYWGSLTEPPCSTFVAWRILTEPAYMSRNQWNQLRTILFTNKDENCEPTSVAHNFSVARPTQPFRGRDLHQCRPSDYVSDVEKERMKEETGNPNWCC